jgi:hypothetical protein
MLVGASGQRRPKAEKTPRIPQNYYGAFHFSALSRSKRLSDQLSVLREEHKAELNHVVNPIFRILQTPSTVLLSPLIATQAHGFLGLQPSRPFRAR